MTSMQFLFQFPALILIGVLMIQQTDGPQEEVPELDALRHYVGNWDSKFSIVSNNGDPDDDKSFTGKVEAKWTVGGRFLDQTGTYQLSSESPPLVIKTLMTFDVNDQKYRYYFFDSSGNLRDSTGKWDAEKKIMTSKMRRSDGEEMTTMADFSKPGIETWQIVITNPNHGRTTTVSGTNTRREK